MNAFSPKYSWEEDYYCFDFTKQVTAPETVTSAIVTITDEDGNDVTSILTDVTLQNITSPKVYSWFRAGTVDETYIMRCRAVTSLGRRLEAEGTLKIKNEGVI